LKTLIFEGAGWDKADHNGVGNCRIRTSLRNKDGRIIYLEMSGSVYSKKYRPEHVKNLNFVGRVDHCFYIDSKWDRKRSYSRELYPIESKHFEYDKKTILDFVNKNLGCDFDKMEVINKGLYIFDSEDPICSCADRYVPYKEIEINIDKLDRVMPVIDNDKIRLKKYKISFNDIKKLPGISEWIAGRTDMERKQFEIYSYRAVFEYNERGIITGLSITAKESFPNIGLSAEDILTVIESVKNFGGK
jgi:hypothetical protein